MQNDRNDTSYLNTVHAHVHTYTRNALMVGNVISVILGVFAGQITNHQTANQPNPERNTQ